VTLKVLTVVGARPQFVKAAMLSRALADAGITEVLVHTGQHYDANMSDVFFDELEMRRPSHHLGIGGGSHGENTGRMLEALERVIVAESPDWVVVYGDTDSTLAGALAAIKRHVRVAHVEAGLRSFNRRMPEEINRVLTDHASTLLFAPTDVAVGNLQREGRTGDAVRLVGDVMCDAARFYGERAEQRSSALRDVRVQAGAYVLLTIHRPSNTDDVDRLRAIVRSLACSSMPVVWPVHPRTGKRMAEFEIAVPPQVRLTDPVGYLDMVMLERHARLIVTDSGGVQKEAYFHGVPCVTLRTETEWTELVEHGVNQLIGGDDERFVALLTTPPQFPSGAPADLYGDGRAAPRMAGVLSEWTGTEC
jgi:UDP-GlcNAc3NAcA epimerase